MAVSLSDAEERRRHLLIRGQAAWDSFGRPTRVAGAISDVTPLHERELALERARQFYARVLDFLPHPVLVKSADHRYVLANRAAGEFLDRPPEAVVGRRTEEVLPGQSPEHLAEDVRVLEDGGVTTREFHVLLDNGNERDAIISKAGVAGLEFKGAFKPRLGLGEVAGAGGHNAHQVGHVRIVGGLFQGLPGVLVGALRVPALQLHPR